MPPGTRRRRSPRLAGSYADMMNRYLPSYLLSEEVDSALRVMSNRLARELHEERNVMEARRSVEEDFYNGGFYSRGVTEQLRSYQEEINRVSERMSSSARNQQSMRRPKAHLKMRDGWTKTIPLPENYGRRLVLPFASTTGRHVEGFRELPSNDSVIRRDFEPVKEVVTTDLRTGYSVKDVWFEER